MFGVAQACTVSPVQFLMVFFFFYQDIFPDKASERRILSYLVRCPCPGCQWMGELREVQVKVMLISGLDSPIFLVRIPL